MLEVPKTAPQQAIKDLGQAFQHFFRRVKQGGKPGYPRFKKRGIHDSFRADNGPPAKGQDAVAVDGRRVRVPKLGWVRMREPLRFQGQIKSLVISRKADRWFAAIAVETETLPHLNAAINLERYASTASSAGIDACGEHGAGATASATA